MVADPINPSPGADPASALGSIASPDPAAAPEASWRRFAWLCAAQTLSMTGGGAASFAIGVWIFERTGSATDFAIISICGILPTILALPLAGVSTDRWGPRRALLTADVGGAATGLVLILMLRLGLDAAWQLGAAVAIGAALASLHWPAYTLATSVVCGPLQLPRAAALMQLGYAGQQVVAPAVAGVGLALVGLPGVLGLDVLTFTLAAVVVARVLGRPRVDRSEPPSGETAWAGLAAAWREARDHRLLRAAAYVALTYLPGGFVVALATPLVLTVTTPERVGVIWAVIGSGMLVGGIVSASLARRTGGIRRMLRFDGLMAAGMIGLGLSESEGWIAAAGFVFLFGLAGHMSEEQGLWQVRISTSMQGRALALRRLLTWSSLPISYALAGPIADHLFEPLLAEHGALAGGVGRVIGTGPGRGMALMLILAGLIKVAIVAAARFDPTLRRLNGEDR